MTSTEAFADETIYLMKPQGTSVLFENQTRISAPNARYDPGADITLILPKNKGCIKHPSVDFSLQVEVTYPRITGPVLPDYEMSGVKPNTSDNCISDIMYAQPPVKGHPVIGYYALFPVLTVMLGADYLFRMDTTSMLHYVFCKRTMWLDSVGFSDFQRRIGCRIAHHSPKLQGDDVEQSGGNYKPTFSNAEVTLETDTTTTILYTVNVSLPLPLDRIFEESMLDLEAFDRDLTIILNYNPPENTLQAHTIFHEADNLTGVNTSANSFRNRGDKIQQPEYDQSKMDFVPTRGIGLTNVNPGSVTGVNTPEMLSLPIQSLDTTVGSLSQKKRMLFTENIPVIFWNYPRLKNQNVMSNSATAAYFAAVRGVDAALSCLGPFTSGTAENSGSLASGTVIYASPKNSYLRFTSPYLKMKQRLGALNTLNYQNDPDDPRNLTSQSGLSNPFQVALLSQLTGCSPALYTSKMNVALLTMTEKVEATDSGRPQGSYSLGSESDNLLMAEDYDVRINPLLAEQNLRALLPTKKNLSIATELPDIWAFSHKYSTLGACATDKDDSEYMYTQALFRPLLGIWYQLATCESIGRHAELWNTSTIGLQNFEAICAIPKAFLTTDLPPAISSFSPLQSLSTGKITRVMGPLVKTTTDETEAGLNASLYFGNKLLNKFCPTWMSPPIPLNSAAYAGRGLCEYKLWNIACRSMPSAGPWDVDKDVFNVTYTNNAASFFTPNPTVYLPVFGGGFNAIPDGVNSISTRILPLTGSASSIAPQKFMADFLSCGPWMAAPGLPTTSTHIIIETWAPAAAAKAVKRISHYLTNVSLNWTSIPHDGKMRAAMKHQLAGEGLTYSFIEWLPYFFTLPPANSEDFLRVQQSLTVSSPRCHGFLTSVFVNNATAPFPQYIRPLYPLEMTVLVGEMSAINLAMGELPIPYWPIRTATNELFDRKKDKQMPPSPYILPAFIPRQPQIESAWTSLLQGMSPSLTVTRLPAIETFPLPFFPIPLGDGGYVPFLNGTITLSMTLAQVIETNTIAPTLIIEAGSLGYADTDTYPASCSTGYQGWFQESVMMPVQTAMGGSGPFGCFGSSNDSGTLNNTYNGLLLNSVVVNNSHTPITGGEGIGATETSVERAFTGKAPLRTNGDNLTLMISLMSTRHATFHNDIPIVFD